MIVQHDTVAASCVPVSTTGTSAGRHANWRASSRRPPLWWLKATLETCRDYYRAAAIYDELRRLSGAELERRGLSPVTLARDICNVCGSSGHQNRADAMRVPATGWPRVLHGRWTMHILLGLSLAICAFAYPSAVNAGDAWPSRPIKLVVPFPAGGNTDAVARLTADFMQKALGGASIVVENHAGAGGIIATEMVTKAAPDGYTLCMCSIGPITIAPATQSLRYDSLHDLAPISLVSTNPLVLLVHPSVKANSAQELVALARAEPNRLNYSSAGIGALTFFSAELFKAKTGTKITHVAYRGGAQATMAVVAGDVQLTFANMADALGQIEGGKIRALGVTTARRSPSAPDIPTLAEQGISGYATESWNALFAPKGTPQTIIDRLTDIAAQMAKDEVIQQRMRHFGSVAVSNNPEGFARMLREETAQWANLVKEMGLKSRRM
jgi:tripartite-type tricarboxylate transporter receptor subunit TctC